MGIARRSGSMKQKRKPFEEKPYDHLEDIGTNACSSTECTGLIPQLPATEEELEAYMEVYDFGPPIVEKNEKNDRNLLDK